MKTTAAGLKVGDTLKTSGKVVSFILPAEGTHQMKRKCGCAKFFVVSFIGDSSAHVLEEFSVLHIERRESS